VKASDRLEEVIERMEARGRLPFSLREKVLEGQIAALKEILQELRKKELGG
jgi:hypothetical protein